MEKTDTKGVDKIFLCASFYHAKQEARWIGRNYLRGTGMVYADL